MPDLNARKERVRLARDAAVGLVSSVLAAWLLATFSVLNLPWALVAGLSLLAMVESYLLFIHRSRLVLDPLNAIGISKIHLYEKISAETAVVNATYSIIFWGISAKRTASSPTVRDAISRVAKTGGEVRFLVMNPNSTFLQERAKEEGESFEAWRNDIVSTIKRLKDLATREGIVIKVRTMDEVPVWRVIIINRSSFYINYYLPSLQGPQSPQLEVTTVEHGLALPYLRQFEACWQRGTDAA